MRDFDSRRLSLIVANASIFAMILSALVAAILSP